MQFHQSHGRSVDVLRCSFLVACLCLLPTQTSSAWQSGSRAPAAPGTTQQPFQNQPFLNQPMSVQPGPNGSPGIPAAQLVDPIFETHDPNSTILVDHSIWDYFLSRYLSTDVQGINRLCYQAVSCEDYQLLQAYIQQLQGTDVRLLNRGEQLAFWFNLYNARTAAVVLQNYPIRSIRQVKEKLTDFVGPFDDAGSVTVLRIPLSLNDIESGIIRPVFKDPRIHYALNCASFGCPNLDYTAWSSINLDARLNGAAYQYINSDRAVKSGLFGIRVSKIYKWYADDFGGEQGVLNHLRQYANCATLNKLGQHQRIASYFYDWSLNDGRIQRRRIFESLIR